MTSPKTVLLTGASRGIGYLTAVALAAKGHRVHAGMRDPEGRNAEAAARLLAETDGRATPLALDVADDASVAAAVAAAEAEGPIDVLINNAGIMPVGVTEGFSDAQLRECFDVNFFGLARVTSAVLPGMRARRAGLLIHLSSSAGRLAIPAFGVYCASKYAVEGYAESLALELAPFGIGSVIVEPSGHATDLVPSSPAPARAEVLAGYGDLAAGRDRLLGMFKGLFDQGLEGNDAANVAAKIVEMVEMEGPRPIRLQVGDDMGVTAINDATAPIQAGLNAALTPVFTGEAAEAAA